MNERQIDEMLNYLSRIASAVETLAITARPTFRPDHSRQVKQTRERAAIQREDPPREPK